MATYDLDSTTCDCYPGTKILINKIDIRNEQQLAENEQMITAIKLAQLEEEHLASNFDFNSYKNIHLFLFEDLYEWAGKIRTINISKKGTHFCNIDSIDNIGNACFSRLKEENYFKGYTFDEYIENIAELYSDLNMLHPFREGNGRTERAFFVQLIRYSGYDIQFSEIDTDLLMVSTIQAANGVLGNLIDVFKKYILR